MKEKTVAGKDNQMRGKTKTNKRRTKLKEN